jgi:hypothetical protein
MMSGYEEIKNLAKERHCNIPDLLVLHRNNDPYYSGSRRDRIMAEWFKQLWDLFGYQNGVHLRRVHYQLISQEKATKHDGSKYQNTKNDWQYLCDAGKHARYLGIIDPGAFEDRRNPEPKLYYQKDGEETNEPGWVQSDCQWRLPYIATDLTWDTELYLPDLQAAGYNYSNMLQPYHVEVWVEKSTMNDVLIPICKKYAVNLITGLGYMSITSVIMLTERIMDIGKPCRIIYISDFDPSGDGMPVAMSRQVQYWLNKQGLDADVKLEPIVLTMDQVKQYNLPRVPIEDKHLGKTSFEQKYGSGAVELDALQSLHPGVLESIVTEYILQFRDKNLTNKILNTRVEAQQILNDLYDKNIAIYQGDLEEIEQKIRSVASNYEYRLQLLSEEMDEELRPIQNDADSLWQTIQNKINCSQVNLPPLPEPETEPNDQEWLFDNNRDYFKQLDYFKNRKGGTA